MSPSQFSEQFLVPLEPGDVAHHTMPYPWTYPGEFDTNLHNETLALEGGRPLVDGDSFAFWRESVRKGIRLEWLRVILPAGDRYTKQDITATYTEAAALADATRADLRVIDFTYVAEMLAKCLPENALGHLYLWGVAHDEPKGGFWRIDTANKAARVSIMHYTNGEFDGHMVSRPPIDDETLAYTDFCKNMYYGEHAVNVYELPSELIGVPQQLERPREPDSTIR